METRPATPQTEQEPAESPSAAPAPMFEKYQIKVKAGVRVGAVPTGNPVIGY